MYSRNAQGRYPRDLRIPKNYGGNAFPKANETERESLTQADEQISKNVQAEQEEHNGAPHGSTLPCNTSRGMPKFNLGFGNLFSKSGISLGLEELLLIGLILILSSEGENDLLILMLVLLLFIQ